MKANQSSQFVPLWAFAICALLLTALCLALLPATAQADETAQNPADLTPGVIDNSPQVDEDADGQGERVVAVPMYRVYNMFNGEHFYTASEYEKDYLTQIGWFYEGVGWQSPSVSETPVYRLYNPNAGDHHYTTSAAERDHLVEVGWNDEGIGWYSDDAETIPVYRQYNPNAVAGAHNFTCSEYENDHLASVGWNAEGVAWYACGSGWSGETTSFSRNHLHAIAGSVTSSDQIQLGYGTKLEPGKLDAVSRLIATDVPIEFLAINARTGNCIARGADAEFYGASTVKAPYVAALCKYHVAGLEAYIGTMQAVIQWSSNEGFNTLVARYGTLYEDAFANESGVIMNYYMTGTAYSYLTPRKLAKLWITIRSYILSDDLYSPLFRSLFTHGYYKEGWMYEGMLGGQVYHVGGIDGDVVYAIMTRYQYGDSRIWAIKDAIVAAVS